MNKTLGVNPEALFEFNLSPFDEKMNALPSPNIVIATPGSANASASSQISRQVQHIEEDRLSPVRNLVNVSIIEEF
jgi:hypothetical protein